MDQWLAGKAKEIRNLRLMKGKNPALLLLKGLLPEVSLGKGRNQSCEYQWACRWLAFSSTSSSSFLYSLRSLGEEEGLFLALFSPSRKPVASSSKDVRAGCRTGAQDTLAGLASCSNLPFVSRGSAREAGGGILEIPKELFEVETSAVVEPRILCPALR